MWGGFAREGPHGMIYRGRNLDVLSLWGELGVDLPDLSSDRLPTFLPKTVCPNPAHDTFKRHFQINTRQPLVHCFAECGISGDYEHAVAMILGLKNANGKPDFKAARRVILKHTRTSLKGMSLEYAHKGNRKSYDGDSDVAKDEKRLNDGDYYWLPKHARTYLDNRGIDDASRGKWQLGFDEDSERIVIPAFDERRVFRFLIRRQVKEGGSLKYLYTRGVLKTSILFGLCLADRDMIRSQGIVLVEGSLDVIRLHQLGIRNAVGILGTGISKKQVRLICQQDPKRIICFFDKDAGGVSNVFAVQKALTKFPISVVRFPRHRSDPAEMTKEEAERAIERALPMAEFNRRARKHSLTKKKKEAIYG